MRIFIDESGDFGWCPPGYSLFCALTVADKTFDQFKERFTNWKRNNVEGSGEAKGKRLLPYRHASFVSSVILKTENARLTLCGTDTRQFSKKMTERFRNDSVTTLRATAKWAADKEKPELVKFYRGMAHWVEKRSAENILWIHGLADIISLAMQHAVIQFMEERDDDEFENIEILIDRSFISKEKHDRFWRELLRNALLSKSQKKPLTLIREWSQRDHPFLRKYRKGNGLLDTQDLYRNHMHFVDSQASEGVQAADICANIAFQHYRGNRKYRGYRLLRSRLCGEGRIEMHTSILTERSIATNAPEDRVRPYSEDELLEGMQRARSRKD